MLRSGVTDGCQVTVMSAPCSCGVFTSTFSRRSRNTHVSFTSGRSTPVSRDVLRGEECVEDRLGEVVEVEGRSSQILWGHSEDHLDGEPGSQGRRSERGLRIGGRHGVAYGLPPADGLAARWVSTHLNPPRVRVIIATLVNRYPSLPGGSASISMIRSMSLYSSAEQLILDAFAAGRSKRRGVAAHKDGGTSFEPRRRPPQAGGPTKPLFIGMSTAG